MKPEQVLHFFLSEFLNMLSLRSRINGNVSANYEHHCSLENQKTSYSILILLAGMKNGPYLYEAT